MHHAAFASFPSAPLPRRAAIRMLAAGAASIALPALAAWPDKPIRIIVTFPAGGASDIVARVMAEQLGKKLGQAVVVDNRPGAGGSVGGLMVTLAPADGYTLMLSNSTPLSIGPFALEKQPYDPVAGFTHIALIGSAPCVVMANPAAPIKTMTDLEAQYRSNTGRGAFVESYGDVVFGPSRPLLRLLLAAVALLVLVATVRQRRAST